VKLINPDGGGRHFFFFSSFFFLLSFSPSPQSQKLQFEIVDVLGLMELFTKSKLVLVIGFFFPSFSPFLTFSYLLRFRVATKRPRWPETENSRSCAEGMTRRKAGVATFFFLLSFPLPYPPPYYLLPLLAGKAFGHEDNILTVWFRT